MDQAGHHHTDLTPPSTQSGTQHPNQPICAPPRPASAYPVGHLTQLDGPGRGLNLVSREALAVASLLHAEVIMATGNENHLLRTALEQVGLN